MDIGQLGSVGTQWFLNVMQPSAIFFLSFFFWPSCGACGSLVPWPDIEPKPLAVKAQTANHWTAREFPTAIF